MKTDQLTSNELNGMDKYVGQMILNKGYVTL